METGSQATSLRALPYRVAARVLWVHRRLFRPTVRGVRCVLVRGDDALLVRHTYGDRRWSWPGGMLRRREPAELAARREIREELGLDIRVWRALGVFEFAGTEGARHLVSCFLADAEGELELERAEISKAAWFPLDRLPDDPMEGTKEIAARARAARGSNLKGSDPSTKRT